MKDQKPLDIEQCSLCPNYPDECLGTMELKCPRLKEQGLKKGSV